MMLFLTSRNAAGSGRTPKYDPAIPSIGRTDTAPPEKSLTSKLKDSPSVAPEDEIERFVA